MPKGIVTVSIDGVSHNDVENSRQMFMKAFAQAKQRINNGSSVRVSYCNAEDASAMSALFGKLKWWSLGRHDGIPWEEKPQKKGFWQKVAEDIWKGT